MLLKDVAYLVRGRLEGDPAFHVHNLNAPRTAENHDLVFSFTDKTAVDIAESCSKAVVTVGERKFPGKNLVLVDNPRQAYVQLAPHFSRIISPPPGIDPGAFVHPSAQIGEGVSIGAFAWIGAGVTIGPNTRLYPQTYIGENTHIGSDCILYPQVVVHEHCRVGNGVILSSGVVIGSDGFGYDIEGTDIIKVPHIGTVEIEDGVEIGANSTVDRATVGSTRIGKNTKIDNLVLVAHNVDIGDSVLIAGQSGLAGSARVGDQTMMGGQAGVVDHGFVGKKVKIGARSVIVDAIPDHSFVSGFPAQNHHTELREKAQIRRLPKLWNRLKCLENSFFGKK